MHIGFLLNHKPLIHIPSNNLPTTNYPPTTHRKIFILQNKHSWENKTISVFYVFDEYNLSFITLNICKSKLTEDLMFILQVLNVSRSSHWRCSIKKGVLRNFAKLRGKHLCQSLFFNKVAGISPATLLKQRLWQRCFPANFSKFFNNTSVRMLLCFLGLI